MNLLTVLFYFAAIGIGFGTVFWVFQLTRCHGYTFLFPYRNFQIAYCVYGFLFFVGQLFVAQTLEYSDQSLYVSYQIIAAMAAPAFTLFAYFLLAWGAALVGWHRPLWIRIAFLAIHAGVYAAAFYGYIVYVRNGDYESDRQLSAIIGNLVQSTILLALLPVLIGAGRMADPVRRRLAWGLGGLHLTSFLLVYLVAFGFIPIGRGSLADYLLTVGSLFFFLTLVPLVFLAVYLKRHRLVPPVGGDDAAIIAVAFDGFDLTQREQEIVPLIAVGLTNDEIAERLFIAPKTVKNNISSIYRKTGLRNRVELANRFRMPEAGV